MGCGQKAASDDAIELESALKQVGLWGDRKWGLGAASSNSIVERVILRSAGLGLDKNATIQQIHLELAIARAQKEFQEELEDRAQYERLKRTY